MLKLLALCKSAAFTKDIFLNYLYGSMDKPKIVIIDVSPASCARSLPQNLLVALHQSCLT